MKRFAMCPQCRNEYQEPRDRRFHAQPNACPDCGPHIELWDPQGKVLAGWAGQPGAAPPAPSSQNAAGTVLAVAADAIRAGRIVALKGLGGFHLVVAAHDEAAVRRLRQLKHREEKPLALMFPSLGAVKAMCEVCPAEERLLRCPEAPIVLLRRRPDPSPLPHPAQPLAASLAPGNPNLGVMLPYTPLHHLLLRLLAFPIVATSGNLSDEPICTDEHAALERLGGIADLFLVHNRPIVRHVDDSIARVMMGRELVLRRARGYAPLPISAECGVRSAEDGVRSAECGMRSAESFGEAGPGAEGGILSAECGVRNAECRVETAEDGGRGAQDGDIPHSALRTPHLSVLAVGAHLKNTVALWVGQQAFISQHIGDLETDLAYEAFRRVIGDFERLYETEPALLAADAHPDYLSTKYALERLAGAAPASGLRLVRVQHHLAHILACMAENEVPPPVLGVSWDGTGYGLDGTVWGGEFFIVTEAAWERVAHLRPFALPGGNRAVREPRRTALGVLFEMFGDSAFARGELAPVRAFSRTELAGLRTMLARRLNSPMTSSAGRLFNAVASLIGLRQEVRFEAQAAMELEFALDGTQTGESYPFSLRSPEHPALNSSFPSPSDRSDASDGSDASDRLHSALRTPHSALVIDWSALIEALLNEVRRGVAPGLISARFHNTLAEMMVEVARRMGRERIVLSGGCFQNRYLTERAVQRLQAEGFRPYWHQRVPPNDGGISLGQVVAAVRGGWA